MTSYSSRLSRHLKNQARKLRHTGDVTNQQALDHVAIDFGFTGWKQAHLHMVWADARIRECESSLHLEVASFAEQLRATIGYPYAVDDRVGLRYMPREAQHVESVARRLVYLRLYEQVHAPEYLNRTENAKLWFRPVMSLEDAEDQITIGRMKLQSLAAKFIDPASHSVFPRERVSLTPELVRTRVLTYLHALHSVSLIRHLGARPESILEHPCFRAFVGYALSGLQAHAQLGATHSVVISFAEMSGWAQPGPTQFDPHLLRWVDQPSELPEERQTASLSLEWPAEHASRPPYPLPQDQHRWLAEYLHSIEQLLPKQPSLRKKAAVIRSTLAGWFAAEYGSAAMATEVYFNSAKSYQSKAFLTPAEARKIQDLLKSLRQSVEEGYAPCTPRSRLLSRLSGLDLAVGRCLERTRHHWQKPNLKVVMDSIGLVAVDPKQEVHIEEEVNWKRAEPMGTSWEESLVASVRPHLFKYWREEDESEGYSFDDSSDDCEASLMEHLHSLAFYRYVGKAKTPDAFTREARKAFYFGVEHAWFKQKLLQS